VKSKVRVGAREGWR